jgi:oxygen-independent coproporphyrinogen-3 oxidase
LGFGVGAARYVHGRREVNTRSLDDYLKRTLAGESPTYQAEELGPEERARETLALQLRRGDGIDRSAFARQTGFALDALAGPAIRRHAELGLLRDDGMRVWLTREGKFVADAVISNLL